MAGDVIHARKQPRNTIFLNEHNIWLSYKHLTLYLQINEGLPSYHSSLIWKWTITKNHNCSRCQEQLTDVDPSLKRQSIMPTPTCGRESAKIMRARGLKNCWEMVASRYDRSFCTQEFSTTKVARGRPAQDHTSVYQPQMVDKPITQPQCWEALGSPELLRKSKFSSV